eukprot:768087-Hanusia_phi.AAC.8
MLLMPCSTSEFLQVVSHTDQTIGTRMRSMLVLPASTSPSLTLRLLLGALEIKWAGSSRSHSTGSGRETEASLLGKVRFVLPRTLNVRTLLVSWAGSCSSGSDTIELSPSYAECLGRLQGWRRFAALRCEAQGYQKEPKWMFTSGKTSLSRCECSLSPSRPTTGRFPAFAAYVCDAQARAINAGYILPIWLSAAGGQFITMRILAVEHLMHNIDNWQPTDIFFAQDVAHLLEGKICSVQTDETVKSETGPEHVSKIVVSEKEQEKTEIRVVFARLAERGPTLLFHPTTLFWGERTRLHRPLTALIHGFSLHQRQQLLSPVGARVLVASVQGMSAQPAKVVVSPVEMSRCVCDGSEVEFDKEAGRKANQHWTRSGQAMDQSLQPSKSS